MGSCCLVFGNNGFAVGTNKRANFRTSFLQLGFGLWAQCGRLFAMAKCECRYSCCHRHPARFSDRRNKQYCAPSDEGCEHRRSVCCKWWAYRRLSSGFRYEHFGWRNARSAVGSHLQRGATYTRRSAVGICQYCRNTLPRFAIERFHEYCNGHKGWCSDKQFGKHCIENNAWLAVGHL